MGGAPTTKAPHPPTTKAADPTRDPAKCDKCVPSYYCNGKHDRRVQSPFDMSKYFDCKDGVAGECSTCPGKQVYIEVCAMCMMFDPRKSLFSRAPIVLSLKPNFTKYDN